MSGPIVEAGSVPGPTTTSGIRAAMASTSGSATDPDRDDNRDRHAALPGRTVGRGDRGVGGRVDVGIGQHDHVVLRPTERLHPLAVGRAGLVDVAGDGRAAHERHRVDIGMGQQGIHRFGVALDDVEHAVGEAGPLHQLRQ